MLLHFEKSDVIAFFCFVLYLIKHLDISLNICIIYEKHIQCEIVMNCNKYKFY